MCYKGVAHQIKIRICDFWQKKKNLIIAINNNVYWYITAEDYKPRAYCSKFWQIALLSWKSYEDKIKFYLGQYTI